MVRPSAFGRAALVITGVWLFLFLLGYPLPFIDDFYFMGAAVNLAYAGVLYNPWCPAIQLIDPRPEFFVYMPFHGYVLSGWIRLFGLSRDSVDAFQCLTAGLCSLGLWVLARRFSGGLLLPLGLCAVTLVFLNSVGQRPESLGLVLLLWGWILLEMPQVLMWLLGGTLLCSSMFTSPNIGVLAPVVVLWISAGKYRTESHGRLAFAAGMLTGGAVVAISLFLAAIHFELSRFLLIFSATRKIGQSFMSPGLFQALSAHPVMWRDAARSLLQVFEPMGLLTIVTLAMIAWPRHFSIKPARVALVFLWITAAVLFIPALSSAAGNGPLNFYVMVVALVATVNVAPSWRFRACASWGAFFVVFLAALGHGTLQLFCHPHISTQQAQVVRDEVARQPPAKAYVDEFALAAVFDYRMPQNGLDYHFGLADRFGSFAPQQFPVGSRLAVSKETLVRVHVYDHYKLGPPPALMPVIGRFFTVKIANPYDVVVVPGG